MSPEMEPTLRIPPPPITEARKPGILEQKAAGLDRSAIMRDIAGPAFTNLLRPVYSPEISEQEKGDLVEFNGSLDNIGAFFSGVAVLLAKRQARTIAASQDDFHQLRDLVRGRRDLFHHGASERVIDEGVLSGLTVPFTLSLQIFTVEKEMANKSLTELEEDSPPTHMIVDASDVTAEDLIEIMERESFDEILMHLTKGPNGFLGEPSSSFSPVRKFFNFSDTDIYSLDKNLGIEKVFAFRDGVVTGLSGAYYMSANARRREIQETARTEAIYTPMHQGTNSSGCPVRHGFPNPETGEVQEPLVITAKKFLVAALRASKELTEKEAM